MDRMMHLNFSVMLAFIRTLRALLVRILNMLKTSMAVVLPTLGTAIMMT